jgi:hypothetical protein
MTSVTVAPVRGRLVGRPAVQRETATGGHSTAALGAESRLRKY